MLRGESLVVRQCHIHHCGAGGIGISSTNLITDKTYENRSSSCVEECKIEHTGFSNANLVGANIKVNFEKKENGYEY